MAEGLSTESGHNDMELLVFKLDQTRFGINVAKIREIIQRPRTVRIPHAPHAVEGSFKLRDRVLTLISLGKCFGMEGEQTGKGEGLIIIVEFNRVYCGVLVDSVECIHQVGSGDIEPPARFLTAFNAPITGICRVNDQTVLIADFESVLGEILGVRADDAEHCRPAEPVEDHSDVRIVFADDSIMLRTAVTGVLKRHGYTNITVCTDGLEAWNTLENRRGRADGPCDIVISDIEMPRLNGLRLTSRIKQDADFSRIPVVLFSSLISDDTRLKGEQAGADAQVSKPDSDQMVEAVRAVLAGCDRPVESEPATPSAAPTPAVAATV